MKTLILQVLLLTFLFGCSTSNHKDEDQSANTPTSSKSPIDTLYKLLDQAASCDTLEFNPTADLYIKAGYLLETTTKSAVLIYRQGGSNFYTIELYAQTGSTWEKKDQIDSLEINPVQFNVEYADYNMDHHKDILFQKSASNGVSISYKYILIVDPQTNKIKAPPSVIQIVW